MRSRFFFTTVGNLVLDADYQAVLDYATLQGYSLPSTAQKRKQNQFLLDLKSAGVWSDLDLLYVLATNGDSNFAKINWKNPGSKTITQSGTVTFTTNEGFTGDGSTGYLDTGWNPAVDAVNYTLNEGGAFVYVNNECTAGNLYQYGVSQVSTDSTALAAKYSGSVHRYGLNSTTVPVGTSPVSSVGLFHSRRVLSNDLRLFKDGSQVGSTSTQASTALSGNGNALVLLAFNANGTVAGHSNAQIGVFGIGASLTGQESALYTAWNTYFSSL